MNETCDSLSMSNENWCSIEIAPTHMAVDSHSDALTDMAVDSHIIDSATFQSLGRKVPKLMLRLSAANARTLHS